MARYENGWIKVHRRAVIEDIGDNVYALGLWVMLLSLATWKETKILWNGEQRRLPPGTVVFGITEFADRWGCSKSTVSKWLSYLHKTERISLEASTRGCIATICNWEKYQTFDEEVRTPSEHGANTARTRREHGANLNEEGKKERKKERNTLSEQEIENCRQEWKATLEHFKINRSISPQDEINLAKAAIRFGTEWVLLALRGARKQQKSASWDPAQFVSLSSYLDPAKIERLVNIGAGNESGANMDWASFWKKVDGAA